MDNPVDLSPASLCALAALLCALCRMEGFESWVGLLVTVSRGFPMSFGSRVDVRVFMI